MKKYIYFTLCLIVMVIFFFIGYRTILNSNNYGEKIANNRVAENTGIDTEIYRDVYLENLNNYRVIGCIISVLSGIGIIVFAVELGRSFQVQIQNKDSHS